MNNLWVVLKATFINDWGLNGFSKNVSGTKEKRKMMMSSLVLLIGAMAIAFTVTMYAYLMADALESIGFLDLLLMMAGLMSVMMVFFTSIYKAQGTLFTSRDYDMLMSLPIKDSVILTSKIINLLVFNWIFTAFVLIPTGVIYYMRVPGLSWLYFVILIISVIFMPLIPVIIASILAVFISYFATKFKHKNLVTILGATIVTLLILIGSFNINSIIESLMINSASIMEGIGKIYIPVTFFTNALRDTNLIELVKLIAISIVPFIIFIIVFSRLFGKINARLGENYKKANYKIQSLKSSSIAKALLQKEIRRYFSTPIYVLNTGIGMIIILVASIATLFVDGQTLAMYMEMPYVDELMPLNVLLIIAFGIGISCTTTSSISLEGKNLWIMKSLPIREKDIFRGKILLNLIITIPLGILANLIFSIGLKFSFAALVWNLAFTIVFSLLTAIVGLLINLYLPKLDWVSPTVVVKQSAAVMIEMLFVFAIIGLSIGAFLLFKVTNITMFLLLLLGILVILLIISYRLLNTIGIKKFIKL